MRGTEMHRVWRFGVAVLAAAMLWSAVPALPVRAATIFVTNLNDGGGGSLRDAIDHSIHGDTIDATGVTGAIALDSQLVINKSISIYGSGAGRLTINGVYNSRVLLIQQPQQATPINVSLFNFSVIQGSAPGTECGGGIATSRTMISGMNVAPSVSVEKLTINHNRAAYGAGICASGSLSIVRSTFEENATDPGDIIGGGGVFSDDWLRVTDSIFARNRALGGAAILGSSAASSLTVERSIFTANRATDSGGAIHTEANALVGTMPSALIVDSTFTDNRARQGGAVRKVSAGRMDVRNSTFGGNQATSSGGAIATESPTIVTNSTISVNGVISQGGSGVVGGGGIFATAVLSLFHDTIVENVAQHPGGLTGGGIFLRGIGANLTPGNTILANNVANFAADLALSDGALVSDVGGNVVFDSPFHAFRAMGDITSVRDPLLAPLGRYTDEGYTETRPPFWNSPVIDAGVAFACLTLDGRSYSADQRSIARPQLGKCDIGAVESRGFRVELHGAFYGQMTVVNTPFPLLVSVRVRSNDSNDPVGSTPMVAAAPVTFKVNPEYGTGEFKAAFEGGAHSVTVVADATGRATMPRLIAGPMPGTVIVNISVPHMNDGGPNATFAIVMPGAAPTARPMGMTAMGTPTPVPSPRPAAPTVAPTPAPAPTRRP